MPYSNCALAVFCVMSSQGGPCCSIIRSLLLSVGWVALKSRHRNIVRPSRAMAILQTPTRRGIVGVHLRVEGARINTCQLPRIDDSYELSKQSGSARHVRTTARIDNSSLYVRTVCHITYDKDCCECPSTSQKRIFKLFQVPIWTERFLTCMRLREAQLRKAPCSSRLSTHYNLWGADAPSLEIRPLRLVQLQ